MVVIILITNVIAPHARFVRVQIVISVLQFKVMVRVKLSVVFRRVPLWSVYSSEVFYRLDHVSVILQFLV